MSKNSVTPARRLDVLEDPLFSRDKVQRRYYAASRQQPAFPR
jgi:hypothetical protein